MKLKIKTSDIKKFMELSDFVKTEDNDAYPILKHIRCEIDFGMCTFTKQNKDSFCKQTIVVNEPDVVFYISVEKIKPLVRDSKKEYVNFEILDDLVKMTDGYYKQSFSMPSDKHYPIIIPEINKQYTRIEKDVLLSLISAKTHIGKDELFPHFLFVYFDGQYVYSSNSQAVYIKKFEKELPAIAISFNECSLLSNFEYVDYSVSDNFNTYSFDNVIFGFIQSSQSGFSYQHFLSRITRENYLKINKEDVINFCQSSLNFVGSGFCTSSLSVSGKVAVMKYEDATKNEENLIETEVTLYGDSFTFGFNPSVWLPILKTLNYAELCLSNEQGCVGIFNEKDDSYIGLISKMNVS